jgi:hypothetical protein
VSEEFDQPDAVPAAGLSAPVNVDALPPTQYLILEVLGARHRLGEPFWTFPDRLRPAACALEAAGLVIWKHGVAARSIQVWLTHAGRAAALMPSYVPPIEDRIAQAIGDPGSIVGKRKGPGWGKGDDGYAEREETVPRWSTRAVLAVLRVWYSGPASLESQESSGPAPKAEKGSSGTARTGEDGP